MVRPTAIAVECENCGLTSGSADVRGDSTRLRCDECGRFARETDRYCARHDVRLDRLPPGYSECPRCQQEREREQMIAEDMARRGSRNMHPTIDAPRR